MVLKATWWSQTASTREMGVLLCYCQSGDVKGEDERTMTVGKWEIKTQEPLREELIITDWVHEDTNDQRRKEVRAMLSASATWCVVLKSLVTIFQLLPQSPPRGHIFSPSLATLSITCTKYRPVNWSHKRPQNKESPAGTHGNWCLAQWDTQWPKILEPLIHSSKPAMKTAVVMHPNPRPLRKAWPQSATCNKGNKCFFPRMKKNPS